MRITKKQVKEAAARLQRTRANYHPNDLTVCRAEIAYQEIKDAYSRQELHRRHVKVDVCGSIVVIRPKSDEAVDWMDANVANPDNPSEPMSGECYCEPRYAADILHGMMADLVEGSAAR